MMTPAPPALLDLCRALGTWLHRDQLDKQDQPYVGHLERVAAPLPEGSLEQCTAWLHDSIEDGKVTHKTLHVLGIPPEVVGAVGYLTRALWHQKSDGGYAEYIQRIVESGNEIAVQVKLADLADNLDPARGPIPDSLRLRYERAIEALRGRT